MLRDTKITVSVKIPEHRRESVIKKLLDLGYGQYTGGKETPGKVFHTYDGLVSAMSLSDGVRDLHSIYEETDDLAIVLGEYPLKRVGIHTVLKDHSMTLALDDEVHNERKCFKSCGFFIDRHFDRLVNTIENETYLSIGVVVEEFRNRRAIDGLIGVRLILDKGIEEVYDRYRKRVAQIKTAVLRGLHKQVSQDKE